ncbi:MAG: hypothetical protein A3C93_02200 [Candidatus Lloydbacteria bacterium RIFCSPHIGHO2_02_FULL_54_17]|uniref:Uncharacterized protein n=1 Tax=Candidatus Lloydbacteria bacterium RIFCSPHIGHO2_02_FULL_54_17 TaxID=1798664 RepID=A0A1G2DDL5_9BACT|nr:MAG: hypothetical protein A2762_02210 [Candidatus Lloydbacteria bacterium RIFCSPHIGHO2_01_FULL_54_11]OGZ11725.1 MAG: hypothetical protein A3C93_02200 [Candidatus Lloydbacteria bacterium RIFCSPHIGHO2_02_FULL_54_17]OGZ14254.1 MAG: hypothetical protein A2948_01535 [Candidatus Lloydbacteria bacterium RIFCSPLOWO2_01_FULL_54_18]OGZ16599.1 MAG: hypothetical protein A3H76_04175 [Candidatus Lloydbacteria bacterium RIFCSPLOWO2_02_FULL_54_12]
MTRFNRLASTLFAASLSLSAFFAQPVFAQSDGPEAVVAKIEVLEQREAQLKADIAQLHAEIDAVDAEVAKLVVQASATANELMRDRAANDVDRSTLSEAESMEQLAKDLTELAMAVKLADMQLRLEQLVDYRGMLEAGIATATVQLPRDDTLGGPRKKPKAKDEVRIMPVPPDGVPVKAGTALVVSVAEFTARTPAEGWCAWKRQSQAWKRAHPWEGPTGVWCANSARLGIPCTEAAWKKVPAGTMFLLPAPDVRVHVPQGVEAPKAITLAPTADPQLFSLDLSTPVVTLIEKVVVTATPADKAALASARDDVSRQNIIAALAIIFGFLALLFFIFLQIAWNSLRSKDDVIAEMGSRLDNTPEVAPKPTEGGCCKAAPPPPPNAGAETYEHGCCRHDKPETD